MDLFQLFVCLFSCQNYSMAYNYLEGKSKFFIIKICLVSMITNEIIKYSQVSWIFRYSVLLNACKNILTIFKIGLF